MTVWKPQTISRKNGPFRRDASLRPCGGSPQLHQGRRHVEPQPRHPQGGRHAGTPAQPSELETPAHHIVGFLWSRTGKTFPYTLRRDGQALEVQGRYLLAVDDGNAYLAAGLAGLGVLWLPQYMAQAPLAAGELLPLFEDWQVESMPLHVAFAPTRHVSAKLRVFIEWVAELMAQHAPLQAPVPAGSATR